MMVLIVYYSMYGRAEAFMEGVKEIEGVKLVVDQLEKE